MRETISNRGRLVRVGIAVALAVAAVGSLRRGKRLRSVLAGAGAVALGYSVASGARTTGTESETETAGAGETADAGERTETADESGDLRCAVCGEPILPGQRRGPNDDGEIVHEACEEGIEQV